MVARHGASAPITAVNKVRSGGFAGFFCREEYEVILGDTESAPAPTPPDDETVDESTVDTADGDAGGDPVPTVDLRDPNDEDEVARRRRRIVGDGEPLTRDDELAMLREQERLAAIEAAVAAEIAERLPPVDPDDDDPNARGPITVDELLGAADPMPVAPPGALEDEPMATDHFHTLLERHLADTEAEEAAPLRQAIRPDRPVPPHPPSPAHSSTMAPTASPPDGPDVDAVPTAAATVTEPTPANPAIEPTVAESVVIDVDAEPVPPTPKDLTGPDEADAHEIAAEIGHEPAENAETEIVIDVDPVAGRVAADPTPDAEVAAAAAVPTEVDDRPRRVPSSRFWVRLYRTRRELEAQLPATSAITAVVGPLARTMPVIRTVQCETGIAAADVIVLTDRSEVVSEPSWQLVRSGQQMMEAAEERSHRAAVLAVDVDVDLPVWVEPLIGRLRRSGLGVARYVVDHLDQIEILVHHRGADAGDYVIDINPRIEPKELVALIDRGLPIATVAGVAVNAELLMAMRGLTVGD